MALSWPLKGVRRVMHSVKNGVVQSPWSCDHPDIPFHGAEWSSAEKSRIMVVVAEIIVK